MGEYTEQSLNPGPEANAMLQRKSEARSGYFRLWGTVTEVGAGSIGIAGISAFAGVGNEIRIEKPDGRIFGEILHVGAERVTALLFSRTDAVRIGDKVYVEDEASIRIGDDWLGSVIDFRGEVAGVERHRPHFDSAERRLYAPAASASTRREMGERLATGLMVTDTLLPICRGQRIGLFAGSGVGKSKLIASFANGLSATRVVIALIGERSREVNEFVRSALAPEIVQRTVFVTATSGESPGAKKRAAYCAMAAAEHFRDQGHSVLLLFDSVTRFAEAHRETALLAGETPALSAFPPSTVRIVAELAERAGPGPEGSGDITAIFSVLVAGSNMEEPVADMVRGILDGHIVLSREIAERGRFPAIDVLRSVSRALPGAASGTENAMLRDYRRMTALYGEVAPMLRANLYEPGIDAASDRAIRLFPGLDAFAGQANRGGPDEAYRALGALLSETAR
jgi:flagellum-specific ATP synthase